MIDWHTVPGYFGDADQADYDLLVNQIPDGGRMAEIGCYRGRSLASIAPTIIKKNLEVLAVDVFDIVPIKGYDAVENIPGMYNDFLKTLQDVHIFDKVEIFVGTSRQAAILIDDMFDLIFFDGDHAYEAIKEDDENWWPRLKFGGILCGHDYSHDVKKYIDERFFLPNTMTSSIWWVTKQ